MFPSDLYMGVVYDSLRILGMRYQDFFIDIKPKCGYDNLIHGPVLTTYGEVVSTNEKEYEKLDNIRLELYKKDFFYDNPIVFLQSNDSVVAHSGDITSLIYKKLGAVGFVTDGNVRDIDVIDKLKFPVFCKGENPIDAINYWALTKYNVPIVINNVQIFPKDYCFASRDGIIVVKKELFEKVKTKIVEQIDRENAIRNKINNNLDKDYLDLVKIFGRW